MHFERPKTLAGLALVYEKVQSALVAHHGGARVF